MSVDEIIAQLQALEPEDRERIKLALDALELRAARPSTARNAADQRGRAAWARLMDGLGEAGGKCLSEGIDEALYRDDR